MENKIKKCSFEEHFEVIASFYCIECKIYLCNKCEILHSKLFKSHNKVELKGNLDELFTGFCLQEKHSNELKYFCKTHNQLCCAACLCKIKDKEYGQHKDCDVCNITDIQEKKRNELKKNIEYLKYLKDNLFQLIGDLKLNFDKMNENKEKLKKEIQSIFTNRNALNEGEDQLLLKTEEFFNNFLFKEEIIKESIKFSDKIKLTLDKSNVIYNKWINNNKLNSIINDCIKYEKNMKEIKEMNDKIKKYSSLKINVKFSPKENEIN